METTDLLVEHDMVHREETPGEPILHTKLYRPLVPADIVPRPRLVDLLEAGRHRPLTLISAAAGYGKSTLASQWLETSDCPGGWVCSPIWPPTLAVTQSGGASPTGNSSPPFNPKPMTPPKGWFGG